MWSSIKIIPSSPVCAAVSARCVSEVRFQERVLVDSSHQAVNVRSNLLLALHQRQHDVQGFLSVTWQVPPTVRVNTKHTTIQVKEEVNQSQEILNMEVSQ